MTDKQLASIRSELLKVEIYSGMNPESMAKLLAISPRTYFLRKREPDRFSLGELMTIARVAKKAGTTFDLAGLF